MALHRVLAFGPFRSGGIWHVSALPEQMALAVSLKAERGDERGLRALESELFADSERMSAVTASAESSFCALTAEQMVYLAECDGLALAESEQRCRRCH